MSSLGRLCLAATARARIAAPHTNVITRGKHVARVAAGKKRRRRASARSAASQTQGTEYPHGLSPVDYSLPPPIYKSPPPPPPRPGAGKYGLPISLVLFFGTVLYVYANNKNDSYDYWRAMQSGQMVLPEDEDYDEFDDEEEEEE